MKRWLNIFAFLPALLAICQIIYLSNPHPISLQPNSPSQYNLSSFENALHLSKLKYANMTTKNELIEIQILEQNQNFLSTLSTNENPIAQVAALQKLIKIANMDGRTIQYVDLSLKRPYATFKNN